MPRRPHGQRSGERDVRPLLAGEPGQAQRDVHVGGGQDAGRVERAQRLGRAQRQIGGVGIDLGDHSPSSPGSVSICGAAAGARRGASPSSTSLSRATRPGGGRQENTPHGASPTTGVSGPDIPRRKRYSTPARLRSGS